MTVGHIYACVSIRRTEGMSHAVLVLRCPFQTEPLYACALFSKCPLRVRSGSVNVSIVLIGWASEGVRTGDRTAWQGSNALQQRTPEDLIGLRPWGGVIPSRRQLLTRSLTTGTIQHSMTRYIERVCKEEPFSCNGRGRTGTEQDDIPEAQRYATVRSGGPVVRLCGTCA